MTRGSVLRSGAGGPSRCNKLVAEIHAPINKKKHKLLAVQSGPPGEVDNKTAGEDPGLWGSHGVKLVKNKQRSVCVSVTKKSANGHGKCKGGFCRGLVCLSLLAYGYGVGILMNNWSRRLIYGLFWFS